MNSKVGLLFGHFFKGSLKKQTTLLLVLLWTLCKYSFIIQAHRISAARQITTMWTVRIWLWKEILTPILNVTSADYTINFNFCCLTLPCFPKQSVMVKCFHLQNLGKLICVKLLLLLLLLHSCLITEKEENVTLPPSLSIRPSYGARGEEILDGGGGRERRERKAWHKTIQHIVWHIQNLDVAVIG